MEFSLEKMHHALTEKRKMTHDGRKRTTKSRKDQNAWRKRNRLGILGVETIKQVKMKEKIKIEYLRRKWKLLEAKLCGRHHIKGINT